VAGDQIRWERIEKAIDHHPREAQAGLTGETNGIASAGTLSPVGR